MLQVVALLMHVMHNAHYQLLCRKGAEMISTAATERDTEGGAPEIRPPGFVAREAELARLTAALARPPAVVLVEGEAGMGKSRLIREYMDSRSVGRARPLLASCPPFQQPCTLGPIVDAARQATDDVRGLRLSDLAGALRPLFPEWAAGLPPAPEPLEDATAARHRLYRALAELLDCLTVGLLVVEDVHWGDEATVEFLLFLVARQPQRIRLLVTWRTEDVPGGSVLRRLSARLPAGTNWERITLGPLDVAATAELVASMLPGGQVSPEFAEFLHANTDGLPLAIEESVRLLRDRRDLRRRGTVWVRRHLDALAVPPTIRDIVLERVARLDPAAQAVLQTAAALAEPSVESVVLSVSGDAGRSGLPAALACGLLEEDFPPSGSVLVSFRHTLAARAVYEDIPSIRRRELHRRVAQALEGQTPPPVAQLARHFREAGDVGRWCHYAERAADQALTVGDQLSAAALLHDLVTKADLPAAAVVRLVRRIPLLALAGYSSRPLIDSLRSLLADTTLSPADRAEVGFQLGRLLMNAGEYQAGADELERAIPGLTHRPADAARAMILLGYPMRTLWPATVHRRWLERGWLVAQDAAISDDYRLSLAINRVSALLALGDEAGWVAGAELPADASDPRRALEVVRGLVNTGDAAMRWGRYGDARRRMGATLEAADQHDFPRLHDGALTQLAHLDWFTGRWDRLQGRVAPLTASSDDLIRLEATLVQGLLDAVRGDSGAAPEQLMLVRDQALQRGIVDMPIEPAAALGRLRLRQGQVDEALELTDEPMRVIAVKEIWIWATDIAPVRVQALASTSRTSEAAELTTAYARGLSGLDAPAPRASLITCQAHLVETRGEHSRAAALFARAADNWRSLPRPYDALLAQERQACCLLTGGRFDAGLSLLREVYTGLSELGASGDAERVARSLREHGVTAWHGWRGGRRGYGARLSPRELEVVRLAVAGRNVREIADELCRSPGTVYTQLRSARRKLGVSSGTGLAVRAAETGAVTEADTEHPL